MTSEQKYEQTWKKSNNLIAAAYKDQSATGAPWSLELSPIRAHDKRKRQGGFFFFPYLALLATSHWQSTKTELVVRRMSKLAFMP
jgi:hypothetical protein